MKHGYVRDRVALRNPRTDEDALLVNVEYWSLPASLVYPPTRMTPTADMMLRSRLVQHPTWTRLALVA